MEYNFELTADEKEFTASLRKNYGLHSMPWFFDHIDNLTSDEKTKLLAIQERAESDWNSYVQKQREEA